MAETPILDMAVGGFGRFSSVWDFEDFWTRGNTFDAALRFVTAAQRRWPDDPRVQDMQMFLRTIIGADRVYLRKEIKGGYWADDYGWWGIACVTARNYLMSVADPNGAAEFLGLAEQCWAQMIARGYDKLDTARPVPHGCANAESPTSNGTKNTVTNANLFVLSVRLAAAIGGTTPGPADPYLAMAYAQYLWFKAWFTPAHGYLWPVNDPVAMVQERPIGAPDYEHKDRPTWEPGWVWSADQGLMLAGLIGCLSIRGQLFEWAKRNVPGFDPRAFQNDLIARANTILAGAKTLLFGLGFTGSDHVLREAPFNSSFSDDAKDYVCGRGVLLRYLAEIDTGSALDEPIKLTADALWATRDTSNNQFAPQWRPAGDAGFNQQFRAAWGYGDGNTTWEFDPSWPQKTIDGIVQATGLDVLRAAILAGQGTVEHADSLVATETNPGGR